MRLAALKYADSLALVDGERRWTFAAFERNVANLAARFSRAYPFGSRIVLLMANRAELLLIQAAAERAGLVRVPLNAKYTWHEVRQIVLDCAPAALFCDSGTRDVAARACGEEDVACELVDVTDPSFDPAARDHTPPDESTSRAVPSLDDLCSINYTSGTSGDPKGVVLTHRNWQAVARNMLIDRDISSSDVLAHIGPLTHASGAYFQPFFLRGATSVLVQPPNVERLLETIETARITGFTCVPTVLTRIVNLEGVDSYDLSSLRWIGYGGEPMPASTLRRAQEIFGPILTLNYGLTEAMMTCTTFKPPLVDDGGAGEDPESLALTCIGRPYTFVQAAIRAPDGMVLSTGDIGELTFKAEQVMQGYWNKPAETAEVLKDGWLWSGDLAWMDEAGYIYLAGRSKDMLISGGFNIYPAEVEAIINAHPAVRESAVLGVPNEDFGEIAVAIVAADRGTETDGASLREFCRPKLGIKTPKKWIFVESLPRTMNNKIDRKALLANIEGLLRCVA